jgi:type IV fimbrial biogenesis protein FimT
MTVENTGMTNSKGKGYSLIELLVALAVIGVLSIVGIPAYQGLVARNKADAVANSVVAGLQYARAAAIKLGIPVRFCMSDNQKTCGGTWEAGQIVIASGTAGKVLRVFPALAVGDKLAWDSSLGVDSYVEFSPLGTTTGQKGSFYYCPAGNDKYSKAVIVSFSGRIRVASERADGTKIECK